MQLKIYNVNTTIVINLSYIHYVKNTWYKMNEIFTIVIVVLTISFTSIKQGMYYIQYFFLCVLRLNYYYQH